jgi:hypothetical protein
VSRGTAALRHDADQRQPLRRGEWGLQQYRVDDAEHRDVGAGAERQHHDRGRGEAWRPSHQAQGVFHVVAEHAEMFANRGREERGNFPAPEPGAAVAAALVEIGGHRCGEVAAELAWQHVQQRAEHAGADRDATFGRHHSARNATTGSTASARFTGT